MSDQIGISGEVQINVEPALLELNRLEVRLDKTVGHFIKAIDAMASLSSKFSTIKFTPPVGDLAALKNYVAELKQLAAVKMPSGGQLLKSVENLGKVSANLNSANMQAFGENLLEASTAVTGFVTALSPATSAMASFRASLAQTKTTAEATIPVLRALKQATDALGGQKNQQIKFGIDKAALLDAQRAFEKFEGDISVKSALLSRNFQTLSQTMNATGFNKVTNDFGKLSEKFSRMDASQMRIASDTTRGFAIDVRALNTVMGLFGYSAFAQQIKRLAGGMIEATAKTEEYKASLVAVTHDVDKANAMFAEFQQFSIKTPFELPEVMAAGVKLEAITSKMRGFKMSTMDAMNLASDMAMTFQKDLPTAVDTVSKVLSGSARGVEMLRNNFAVSRPELERWGVSMNKQGGVLMRNAGDIQNVIIAMRGLQRETSGLNALSLRENNLSTQLEAIKDNLFKLGAALGESVMPILKAFANGLSYVIGIMTDLPGPIKAAAALSLLLSGALFMLTEKLAGLSIMVLAFIEMQGQQAIKSKELVVNTLAEAAAQDKLATSYATAAAAAEAAYIAKTKAAFESSLAGETRDVMPEAAQVLAVSPAVLANFAKAKALQEEELVLSGVAAGKGHDIFAKMGGFAAYGNAGGFGGKGNLPGSKILAKDVNERMMEMVDKKYTSRYAEALGRQGLAGARGGNLGFFTAGAAGAVTPAAETIGVVAQLTTLQLLFPTIISGFKSAGDAILKLSGASSGVLANFTKIAQAPVGLLLTELGILIKALMTSITTWSATTMTAAEGTLGAALLGIISPITVLGGAILLAIGAFYLLPPLMHKLWNFATGNQDNSSKANDDLNKETFNLTNGGRIPLEEVLKQDSIRAASSKDIKKYNRTDLSNKLVSYERMQSALEVKQRDGTITPQQEDQLRAIKIANDSTRGNQNYLITGKPPEEMAYSSTTANNTLKEVKKNLDIAGRDGGMVNDVGMWDTLAKVRAESIKELDVIIQKAKTNTGLSEEGLKAEQEKSMILKAERVDYENLISAQIKHRTAGKTWVSAIEKGKDLQTELTNITGNDEASNKHKLEVENAILDNKRDQKKEAQDRLNIENDIILAGQRYISVQDKIAQTKRKLEAAIKTDSDAIDMTDPHASNRKAKEKRENLKLKYVAGNLGIVDRDISAAISMADAQLKIERQNKLKEMQEEEDKRFIAAGKANANSPEARKKLNAQQKLANKKYKNKAEYDALAEIANAEIEDTYRGVHGRRVFSMADVPKNYDARYNLALKLAGANDKTIARSTKTLTSAQKRDLESPAVSQLRLQLANEEREQKQSVEKRSLEFKRITTDQYTFAYEEAKKSIHDMVDLNHKEKDEEFLINEAKKKMMREYYNELFQLAMQYEANLSQHRKAAQALEEGKLAFEGGKLDISEIHGEHTEKQRIAIEKKKELLEKKNLYNEDIDIENKYRDAKNKLELSLAKHEMEHGDKANALRASEKRQLAQLKTNRDDDLAAARQKAELAIQGSEKSIAGFDKKDKLSDLDDRQKDLEIAKSRLEYKQGVIQNSIKDGNVGGDLPYALEKTMQDLFKAESGLIDIKREQARLNMDDVDYNREKLKLQFEQLKLSQDTLQKFMDMNAELRKQKALKEAEEQKAKDSVLNSTVKTYASYEEMTKANEADAKTETDARNAKRAAEEEARAKLRDRFIGERDYGVNKVQVRDQILDQQTGLPKGPWTMNVNKHLEDVTSEKNPFAGYQLTKGGWKKAADDKFAGQHLTATGWQKDANNAAKFNGFHLNAAGQWIKDTPVQGVPAEALHPAVKSILDKQSGDQSEKGVEHTIHLILDVNKQKYKWEVPLNSTEKVTPGRLPSAPYPLQNGGNR